MKKIGMIDIAHDAGVGTATVERVLNARGNVSDETIAKVIISAKRLGYNRTLPEKHRGIIRIEILLPHEGSTFEKTLRQSFAQISSSLDRSVHLHISQPKTRNIEDILQILNQSSFHRSGLIFFGPNKKEICERLREMDRVGTHVVSIVSSVETCGAIHHIGIDNRAAGRTAAYFITGCGQRRGGRIAVLHNGEGFGDHEQRIEGFESFISQSAFARNTHLEFICHGGDFQLAAYKLDKAIEKNRDIYGVYNAAGGNLNLSPVLKKWKAKKSLFVVAHEWVSSNQEFQKAGLLDVIIDQSPERQARWSVDYILGRLGITEHEIEKGPIPFVTMTRAWLQN